MHKADTVAANCLLCKWSQTTGFGGWGESEEVGLFISGPCRGEFEHLVVFARAQSDTSGILCCVNSIAAAN